MPSITRSSRQYRIVFTPGVIIDVGEEGTVQRDGIEYLRASHTDDRAMTKQLISVMASSTSYDMRTTTSMNETSITLRITPITKQPAYTPMMSSEQQQLPPTSKLDGIKYSPRHTDLRAACAPSQRDGTQYCCLLPRITPAQQPSRYVPSIVPRRRRRLPVCRYT